MEKDDLCWEVSGILREEFIGKFKMSENHEAIGRFITLLVPNQEGQMKPVGAGSFNIVLKAKLKDGTVPDPVIRFPIPSESMFPEEKTRYEVDAMRCVQANTSIPVPRVLHWTNRREGPAGLGPCIVMDECVHYTSVSRILSGQADPAVKPSESSLLDPGISDEKLLAMYGLVAEAMLQLWKVPFDSIGAITRSALDHHFEVTHRPLTMNMNELVQYGGLPRTKLPRTSFSTSQAYFEAMAQLHMDHLLHQRNDAVSNVVDCAKKYVARCLFRSLARQGRLHSPLHNNGPFRFFCDDLEGANFLLNNDLQVMGVIDWEFSNALPMEFAQSPPWWLLLCRPESYVHTLDAHGHDVSRHGHSFLATLELWAQDVEPRLNSFLKVLRQREREAISAGTLAEDQILSDGMQRSWETGDFWVVLAARRSFIFDAIFWKWIAPRFFGSDDWESLMESHLTEDELSDMHAVFTLKMGQKEARELSWEPEEPET